MPTKASTKNGKSAGADADDPNVSDALVAAKNPPPTGRLIADCHIDLPRGDVVEEIEYEKFFKLNLAFGDVREVSEKKLQEMKKAALPKPKKGQEEVVVEDDVLELPMAIYMPFLQQWQLDGYTQGRIVNSFSLGPGEEQTVEIFTWAKSSSSLTSATSFESEQETESSGSRHDALDVSEDVAHQAGFETSTDGKVGFTVGVAKFDLGAKASGRAALNEGENETRQTIIDATTRSTGRVRTSRTLTVTESQEAGSEERVTRKLTNPNACHTLTVPFFEVLANYQVSTFVRGDEVRLVALIKSSLLSSVTVIDRAFIRSHESALRLALLDSTLADGFEAARFLDARDRACDVLCHSCSCEEEDSGEADGSKWEAVVDSARKVAAAVTKIRTKAVRYPATVREAVPPPFGFGLTPGIINAAAADIRSHLFRKSLAKNAPSLISDLASIGVGPTPAPVTTSQARAMSRVIGALPPPALALLPADPQVADGVGWEMYGITLVFVPEFITAGVVTQRIKDTVGMNRFDDDGLIAAITAFSGAYSEWLKEQEANRAANERLQELARIAKEERNLRILESFGLRETAVAQERLAALLEHLNDPKNLDHYRFAVWNERSGAADDRVTALALAGVIEATPVGIVGDQLAVPIRLDDKPKWKEVFDESVQDLTKSTTKDVRRYILPTAALYSEAIVGRCCACEESIVNQQELAAEAGRLGNNAIRLENKRLEARLDKGLLDEEFAPQYGLCLCGCAEDDDDHRRHGHGGRDKDSGKGKGKDKDKPSS